MEEWVEIDEFPEYGVSNEGRVTSSKSTRIIKPTYNQQGICSVGLFVDGELRRRSLALLVAKAFLPKHPIKYFDTPIHLDGNRSNCNVTNLAWRPHWYAVQYHQQFKNNLYWCKGPIEDIETGELFEDSREIVIRYGLLPKDVMLDLTNQRREQHLPNGLAFRFV